MTKQTQNLIVSIITTTIIVSGGMYLLRDSKTSTLQEASTKTQAWESPYFVFNYPDDYMADEEGLWKKERFENHLQTGASDCSECHNPDILVHTELITGTLEDYIKKDNGLFGDTLVEAAEPLGNPVETLELGDNEFIKLRVADLHDVTTYYTKNGDRIISFKVLFNENDNDELRTIISTLKFK